MAPTAGRSKVEGEQEEDAHKSVPGEHPADPQSVSNQVIAPQAHAPRQAKETLARPSAVASP